MTDVSSYSIGIEFVSGSFTAVTDEVITFTIVRQMGDMFNGLIASEAQVQIRNDDGNLGGTIELRPNVAVEIKATETGSERALFSGKVDEWFINPGLEGPRQVNLSARDEMKSLIRETISTSLQINTNIGSLFDDLISKTTIQSYAIDSFGSRLPFFWVREQLANEAMINLMGTDHAYAYFDPDATLNVKGHYFANLTSVVSSIDDAASGTNIIALGWSSNDDAISNDVTVETIPRVTSSEITSIAALPDVFIIPSSSHISFTLGYIDPTNKETVPASEVVTPVASLDWFVSTDETEANHMMDTTSLTVDIGGGTITASLFNGDGQDAQLRRFIVRGKPVIRLSDLRASAVNGGSQTEFGRLDFTHSNEFVGNQIKSQAFAEFLVDLLANPLPGVELTTRNNFPYLLDRNLGEVIHLTNSFMGVNSDFWIAGIEHTVNAEGGWIHDGRYLMTMVKDESLLILDDINQGSLDSVNELGF